MILANTRIHRVSSEEEAKKLLDTLLRQPEVRGNALFIATATIKELSPLERTIIGKDSNGMSKCTWGVMYSAKCPDFVENILKNVKRLEPSLGIITLKALKRMVSRKNKEAVSNFFVEEFKLDKKAATRVAQTLMSIKE